MQTNIHSPPTNMGRPSGTPNTRNSSSGPRPGKRIAPLPNQHLQSPSTINKRNDDELQNIIEGTIRIGKNAQDEAIRIRDQEIERLEARLGIQEELMHVQSLLSSCTTKYIDKEPLASSKIHELLKSTKESISKFQIKAEPTESRWSDQPKTRDIKYYEDKLNSLEQSSLEKTMQIEDINKTVFEFRDLLGNLISNKLKDKGAPLLENLDELDNGKDKPLSKLGTYMTSLISWMDSILSTSPTSSLHTIDSTQHYQATIATLQSQITDLTNEKKIFSKRIQTLEGEIHYERLQSKLIIDKLVHDLKQKPDSNPSPLVTNPSSQLQFPSQFHGPSEVDRLLVEKRETEGLLQNLVNRHRRQWSEAIAIIGTANIPNLPDLQRLLDNTTSGSSVSTVTFLGNFLTALLIWMNAMSKAPVTSASHTAPTSSSISTTVASLQHRIHQLEEQLKIQEKQIAANQMLGSGGGGGSGLKLPLSDVTKLKKAEEELSQKSLELNEFKQSLFELINRHKHTMRNSIGKMDRPLKNGVPDLELLLDNVLDGATNGIGYLNSYLTYLMVWVDGAETRKDDTTGNKEEALQELQRKVEELENQLNEERTTALNKINSYENLLKKEQLEVILLQKEFEIKLIEEKTKLQQQMKEMEQESLKENENYKAVIEILIEACQKEPLPNVILDEKDLKSEQTSWQTQLYYLNAYQSEHIAVNLKNFENYLIELHAFVNDIIPLIGDAIIKVEDEVDTGETDIEIDRPLANTVDSSRPKAPPRADMTVQTQNYDFLLVQCTDGSKGLYKGTKDPMTGAWTYECKTPGIRGKNTSRVYTLLCTASSVASTLSTFDRMALANQEFPTTALTLGDWMDVVETSQLLGSQQLSESLEFLDSHGALISYNGRTAGADGAHYLLTGFPSGLPGSDGPSVHIHAEIDNGKLAVISQSGNFPLLVKMYIDLPSSVVADMASDGMQLSKTTSEIDDEENEFEIPEALRESISRSTPTRRNS